MRFSILSDINPFYTSKSKKIKMHIISSLTKLSISNHKDLLNFFSELTASAAFGPSFIKNGKFILITVFTSRNSLVFTVKNI